MKKKHSKKKNSKKSFVVTRKTLLALWREGLRRVHPADAVEQTLRRKKGTAWPRIGPSLPAQVDVVAIGKAAMFMALGANRVLKARVRRGLIVVPRRGPSKPKALARFRVVRADHPVPSKSSLRAGRELQLFVRDPDSTIPLLFLISGGASSLAVAPRKGVTLRQMISLYRKWLHQNLPIERLNQKRKRISQIKGGKLLHNLSRPIASLLISDVVGDAPEVIGSGLTAPLGKNPNIRNTVILPCFSVAREIAKKAREIGLPVILVRSPIRGNARSSGRAYAKRLLRRRGPTLLVSFGETTMHVRGKGHGGRNLEFAFGAAKEMGSGQSVLLLSSSTDGLDGNSRASGAFATHTTLMRARKVGLSWKSLLEQNNTEEIFRTLGDLVVTGPTGINHGDVQVAWIGPFREA